jgi:hypothetical protein
LAETSDPDQIVQRLTQTQFKSDSPKDFELDVMDAFSYLGFDSEYLGGAGDTDILLTANIGLESFKIDVECKTSKSGKIIDQQIDWISLRDHRKKNEANFVILVGPEFSGGNLEKRADEYDVSLLRTDDLVRLVQAHSRFPFTLVELKDLFAGRGDRSYQLTDLVSQNAYRRYLLDKFRVIIEEMQALQDRLGYFTIDSLAGREKMEDLDIEVADIEFYIKLLELPFINSLKKIPENRYILTIRTEDIANIFQQISNLLRIPESKKSHTPVIAPEPKKTSAPEMKLGSKYFEWHVTGRSVIARARREDPYDHYCPIDHFQTIIERIVESFKTQDLVSAEVIFSMLIGQELSPGRTFKGKAEDYKIRMALGILEIEGLIKWTGSRKPFEYRLNAPLERVEEWFRKKILKGLDQF